MLLISTSHLPKPNKLKSSAFSWLNHVAWLLIVFSVLCSKVSYARHYIHRLCPLCCCFSHNIRIVHKMPAFLMHQTELLQWESGFLEYLPGTYRIQLFETLFSRIPGDSIYCIIYCSEERGENCRIPDFGESIHLLYVTDLIFNFVSRNKSAILVPVPYTSRLLIYVTTVGK